MPLFTRFLSAPNTSGSFQSTILPCQHLSCSHNRRSLHDEKKGVVDSFKPLYSSTVVTAKKDDDQARGNKVGEDVPGEESLEHTPDDEAPSN